MEPNKESTFNDWADFWRYTCGLNVFGVDTKSKGKGFCEKWSSSQDQGISDEEHEDKKRRNVFSNGIAIMAGKVWHRPDLDGYNLCFIDLDNQKAIEEICKVFGVKDIDELAQLTIVEQHLDNKSKAHVYFYTKYILKKKSSDTRNLKDKLDRNEIPAIEVKCQSDGLAFCTPSPHKDGSNYEIIGVKEIGIFDGKGIESKLFEIYQKYGLFVGDSRGGNISKIPIEDLFKPDFIIKEGHNRSEAVLRVFESLYAKYISTKSIETIRQETYNWMIDHCDPPLDLDKFESQLKDGRNFVDRTITQKQGNVLQQQLKIKNGENTIFKIVDYIIPHKAYYVDEKLGQICYGKLTDDDIFPLKSIINIIPKKLIFYNNPLFPEAEPKVELEFYVNGCKNEGVRKLGPFYSLSELLKELQNKGYVLNKARAEDAFNSIRNAMEEKNESLVEYVNDVTTSGYYFIDKKLVKKNITQSAEAIRKEDVIECCKLLNNLSTAWKNKDAFPTVLRWGMISPFSFIIKCNGSYSRWMPWLQMYGWGDSGKTTLGEIIFHIWNLGEQERSSGFGDLDSTAKFGHYVSEDTYPKLVNEPGNLYMNLKGRFSGVIEMIKSSVEGKNARSKFFDYKNYQKIPALNPLMFASNYAPINEGSYNRRFISIHFPQDEKKEEQEKQIFRKMLEDKKRYLKILGDYIMQYITKDPTMLLTEDWKDITKKILIKFYEFAEMDIPEWIEYFVEQKDAVDESNEKTQFALRAFFRNKINEVYSRNKDPSNSITGLNEKLEYCLKNETFIIFT
jgi:hypothetical protein